MKTETLESTIGNGPMPVEPFIGKCEVARRLNRSLKTVNNWMRRGFLPYYKLGHRVSFRWSEVLEHLQANHLRSRRRLWGADHFPIKPNLSAAAGTYRPAAPAPGPNFTPRGSLSS